MVGLFLVFLWYLLAYQPGTGSFGGVMGQMMGNQHSGGMSLAMPWYVWITVALLFVVLLTGVAGLAYFLTYPEIRSGPLTMPKSASSPSEKGSEVSWEVLMRTSKPEEKRVLEVLAAHQGSYPQKFVVKEAGLSKLKTHRIVSRLAERGVVSVERSGNTNQVSLSPWVRSEAMKPSPDVSSKA